MKFLCFDGTIIEILYGGSCFFVDVNGGRTPVIRFPKLTEDQEKDLKRLLSEFSSKDEKNEGP